MSSVLSKNDIKMLLNGNPPLLEGYLNLEEQLQPNGVDFTLRGICSLQSAGRIAVSNKERVVSKQSALTFDEKGFIHLTPGIYGITYNEIVNLPKNVMALATPRSSLLRCGVTVNTAVWDAGYSGRSESLLVVYNPLGFDLQKDARIVQLVFFRMSGDTEGYNGIYQHENI
ncbi:MAG: deoxyuridine 5'-triphosphate nucleotidohydrolase [Dehalococcoidales bacterium]|jgi:dUTP pyrophosphatase|nr:deoxyuridine 5'-triphosphate nucleotidohydrolase [Dehalococcoidales bacterium]